MPSGRVEDAATASDDGAAVVATGVAADGADVPSIETGFAAALLLRALEQLLVAAAGHQQAERLASDRVTAAFGADVDDRVDRFDDLATRGSLDDPAGAFAQAEPGRRGRLGDERDGQKVHILHAGRRRHVGDAVRGGVDDAVLGGVGARHRCNSGKRQDSRSHRRHGHHGHESECFHVSSVSWSLRLRCTLYAYKCNQ